MKKKIISIFIAVLLLVPVFSLDVPKLVNPVTDTANIISAEQEKLLNNYLHQMSAGSPIQMAVLTIPSLEGEVIENYSIQVVDEWALGGSDTDMGALLLVALDEREIRIEVGYGLEPYLTDAESGQIIRNVIAPYFQSGDYGTGIMAGIQNMSNIALSKSGIEVQSPIVEVTQVPRRSSRSISGVIMPFIFFIIFMISGMASRRGRSSSGRSKSTASNIADVVTDAAILSMLVGNRSHRRGGFYGGGGSSFGGGGFGGFSGGGGGFGGGGASGGW